MSITINVKNNGTTTVDKERDILINNNLQHLPKCLGFGGDFCDSLTVSIHFNDHGFCFVVVPEFLVNHRMDLEKTVKQN